MFHSLYVHGYNSNLSNTYKSFRLQKMSAIIPLAYKVMFINIIQSKNYLTLPQSSCVSLPSSVYGCTYWCRLLLDFLLCCGCRDI